jgi:rod shape-determining protein MreC
MLASLVLCLFSLHLASTYRKGAGGAALVKGLLDLTVAPVQTAILSTKDSFEEMWQGYVYLVGLKEENEAVGLKEENEAMRREIDSLVEENNKLKEEVWLTTRLKELLAFKENALFSTVAAGILGYNRGGGWIRTVTLNKGAIDGIKGDMPLLSADGVVGRIVEVSRSASTKVRLNRSSYY